MLYISAYEIILVKRTLPIYFNVYINKIAYFTEIKPLFQSKSFNSILESGSFNPQQFRCSSFIPMEFF